MRLSRTLFILLLIVPFFLAGAFFKGYPTEPAFLMPVLICIYIPLLSIWRMRSIGMTSTRMLKALFGVFNFREKFRIFTDK